jgi:(p)ppGpp synthase/HD superfamily hydrolase
METNTLQRIIEFADLAHGDQLRKFTGERYIVHPVRVMETCRQYSNDPAVLTAALLHDVLEDTSVSRDDMSAFLYTLLSADIANEAVALVVELTDIFTRKNYPRMNRRQRRQHEFERLARASSKAQTIKYADLIDNCLDIVQNDPDFARVFLDESGKLLSMMNRGDHGLRALADETIRAGRALLKKRPV